MTHPHLGEERLFDCYLADRAGDSIDPPTAEHLADCGACGERYAEFARFMDDLRTEADASTSAVFTPERLALQQKQIAERLEHLGQPAQVITFPTRVGQHVASTAARVAPRWIAAAAAAGLFVGVGLGVFFDSGARMPRFGVAHSPAAATTVPRPATVAAPERITPPPEPSEPAPTMDDEDTFLSDLELALDRPRTHELAPFDEFTPHVRDVANRTR
jgi:anti-sigma factor RsiW